MKANKGQWVRVKCGYIYKLSVSSRGKIGGYLSNGKYWSDFRKNVTAVADTPQELAQVGDLVVLNHRNYPVAVKFIKSNGSLFIHDRYGVMYETSNITAIYTPDSNGNYIKQWEMK